MRGRDIKRYGYTSPDLFLICTFPSKHYDIDTFPAIKKHLLSFDIRRLEQTGKTYFVNDIKIKARKKTTNKWFETQDSISYWEDLSKQKIIYPETTQGAYFALDDEGFYVDKTCFFMISNTPEYLVATLSSELFEFAYKHIFSSIELGKSAYQYNKHAFVLLPVINAANITADVMSQLIEDVRKLKYEKSPAKRTLLSNEIDEITYSIYGISESEKEYIKLNK